MFSELVNDDELRRESRTREWSDGARFIHWVGIVLLGTFLVKFFNAAPFTFTDPRWQLNFISLLASNGDEALLGALLICAGRLFNLNDRQVRNRALFVRTLSSWVALGWLLLIPLQLFLGVRIINSISTQEVEQIQIVQRASRAVAAATNEAELRAAVAQIPNQPPLPRLNVTLEVGKANVLAQFQRSINTLTNRQETESSNRWQTFMREAVRNSIQCLLYCLGFLALGKKRTLASSKAASQSVTPQ
jgi:hypothetical protein